MKGHFFKSLLLLIGLLAAWSMASASSGDGNGFDPAEGEPIAIESADLSAEPAPSVPPAETEPGPRRPPLVNTKGVLFDISFEYRLQNVFIRPLDVAGTDVKQVYYAVQRGRTDWVFGWEDKVKINAQINLLDGVLFGDNGLIVGDDPYPNQGTATTKRSPNLSAETVVVKKGADPQAASSYTLGLRKIDPIRVPRLWGEVSLLAAVLRVGRMPAGEGRGILLNDGNGDANRFGASNDGDTADRILLGTKPVELIKAIMQNSASAADSRQDRGLFLGLAYDQLRNDLQFLDNDGSQLGFQCYYLRPQFELGGVPGGGLKASFAYANRSSKAVKLNLNLMTMELSFGLENFHLETQAAVIVGKTREISDAMSLFRQETKPTVQDVRAWGLLAVADYTVGPVMLTLEFDLATGDDDPRPDSTLEHFYFAEDTKVGLLLFPHVLAFETARSAAAAAVFTKARGSTSYPSTQMDTHGAFTNAIALFPQATWNITPSVYFRFGALFAWAEKPLVDPYETLHHWDGVNVADDAINFNGGKPGRYYGTEFDGRFSAKLWKDHFIFDLEGAVLVPGSALNNRNGDAVTSGLVEGRFTFRY